ncbi:MAG: tail fiber protein [Methylococcaceae bacterium]
MDAFIGLISMFSYKWAPVDWALCDGSTLATNQYAGLYSLIGTTYGGNGSTTFNLPNLLGRVPVGVGAGAGLSARTIGNRGGAESLVLTANQLAAHTHSTNLGTLTATTTVKAATEGGNTGTPATGAYLATGKNGLTTLTNYFAGTPGAPVNLGGVSTTISSSGSGTATGSTGGNQTVPLMNPFLVVNFCIALVGIYPSKP